MIVFITVITIYVNQLYFFICQTCYCLGLDLTLLAKLALILYHFVLAYLKQQLCISLSLLISISISVIQSNCHL